VFHLWIVSSSCANVASPPHLHPSFGMSNLEASEALKLLYQMYFPRYLGDSGVCRDSTLLACTELACNGFLRLLYCALGGPPSRLLYPLLLHLFIYVPVKSTHQTALVPFRAWDGSVPIISGVRIFGRYGYCCLVASCCHYPCPCNPTSFARYTIGIHVVSIQVLEWLFCSCSLLTLVQISSTR
jgi:hypothetical protein